MTVWKYQLRHTDVQDLMLPANARILTVQAQREQACLWVQVDPEAAPERRRIRIHGTGHEIGDGLLDYLGTFQLDAGALVFHVFEELP